MGVFIAEELRKMAAVVIVAAILLLVVLTVLPGWRRRRRIGAEGYAANRDPAPSKRERREAIRNWRRLDHSGRR